MSDYTYKYGIIAIGYRNEKGIRRLLEHLKNAEYMGQEVLFIISIDYSGNKDIVDIANNFVWPNGQKFVRFNEKRLGLREHILKCGDYLNEYELDAVAVFEDDVIPSKDFFIYMKAATEKYYSEKNIAGVSLYAHSCNRNTGEGFSPVMSDGDNYFLQYAQSWGQIWFRNQWNEFKSWYEKNKDNFLPDYRIPANILEWNNNSWLKYHIRYCIEENKYFAYPYISHSTCFNEAGEHTAQDSDECQVVISNAAGKKYQMIDFTEDALKYDAFFENEGLYKYCGVRKEDLTVDLYGGRRATNCPYLLTNKYLDYPAVKSWGNRLRPHEMNIIHDIPGEDIFLYDLGQVIGFMEIPVQKMGEDKYRSYFKILDRWLSAEEQGRNLVDFFLQNHLNCIAIYGWGKMGKHLYSKLAGTSVNILCIIDRYITQGSDGIPVKKMEDDLPQVDAIIVTVTFDFERIRYQLKKKNMGRIISMEEIFVGLC